MFTKRSFNGWKDSFYYPPVPIAHATFRSFEIFLLSCYRYILAWQLVDLTLELLLVFIPGLIWFFDRYLNSYYCHTYHLLTPPLHYYFQKHYLLTCLTSYHHVPLHLLPQEKWFSCSCRWPIISSLPIPAWPRDLKIVYSIANSLWW